MLMLLRLLTILVAGIARVLMVVVVVGMNDLGRMLLDTPGEQYVDLGRRHTASLHPIDLDFYFGQTQPGRHAAEPRR
jgi:hypothetical protein